MDQNFTYVGNRKYLGSVYSIMQAAMIKSTAKSNAYVVYRTQSEHSVF